MNNLHLRTKLKGQKDTRTIQKTEETKTAEEEFTLDRICNL